MSIFGNPKPTVEGMQATGRGAAGADAAGRGEVGR
jgi:hypothetical protein